MKVGSLFTGVGGLDLGLERAGMETRWMCELNDYRRAVLGYLWTGIPIYSDITQLAPAELEAVDLICGGFPCQDISNAGPKTGLAGARSGLWGEMFRVVRELRPRWVFVENVAALRLRGLGRVLGDLASIGYDAEWDCVPASALGAPHQRDRFWLLAYTDDAGRREQRRAVTAPQELAALERPRPVPPDADPQGELQPDRTGREVGGRPRDGGGAAATDPTEIGRLRRHGLHARAAGDEDGSGQADWRGPPDHDGSSELAAALPGWRPANPGFELPASSRPRERPPEPLIRGVDDGVPFRVERVAAFGDTALPQLAEWVGRRVMAYETAA